MQFTVCRSNIFLVSYIYFFYFALLKAILKLSLNWYIFSETPCILILHIKKTITISFLSGAQRQLWLEGLLKPQRNKCVDFQKLKFYNNYIFATRCRSLLIQQTKNSVRTNSLGLKYQRFIPSGWKFMAIIKLNKKLS